MGALYFGDNLDILRDEIKSESIDLVYLDPPFNSKSGYNLLFKTPKGYVSDAQITAFQDTWSWGKQAEKEFAELLHQPNTDVAEMIQSLRRFLKESDMMAYLTMMANRLVELHRVLKPTGSLYLHCDPTASHYLKIVLDTVFGHDNFKNDITWLRTVPKSDFRQGATNFPRVHDCILYYQKDSSLCKTFNQPFSEYDPEYIESSYPFVEPETGRRYGAHSLTAPGAGSRGHPQYEFLGVVRYWRYSKEKMEQLLKEGRIIQSKEGNVPRYKRYLDEVEGVPIGDVWTDINNLQGASKERLGYPTQKPQALLERIIKASSNEGDLVLDPFCGCGTAVHAAQTLKRDWIGIDITHLAISLIEKRMKDAFPSISFQVHGTPKDLDGARNLAERDKYQFQWWACSLVNAQPYQGKKKGADSGIDGLIFFQDDNSGAKKIIVSVKGGENVTRTMIADLKNTVEREKAQIGLFVTLAEPTKPMITEAASAGFYESPHMGAYPKIQILTIADLLSGKEKPNYPDLSRGGLSFKKAKVEQQRAEQTKLEGF
jgi:DNA modification methylase